ncbi:MAG: VOC family protein [Cyclobacteriaceae bacterium]|nr:VOC family protein [Cyclobacteriaceae bacterium]
MRYFLLLTVLLPFISFAQEQSIKTDINVVCLLVKDYDETIQFYTKKLGFEVSMDRKFGESQRWVSIKLSNSPLELSLGLVNKKEDAILVGKQGGEFPFFVITTSNFDETYQNLVSNGVLFIDKPKKNPWGTTAIFTDLYGNQILLRGS